MSDDEPIDAFSTEEEARISRNHCALTEKIEGGEFSKRPLDATLIVDLHRALFQSVRDYAGKHRCKGWGEEHPIILGKRAPHRDDVPRLLAEMLREASQRHRSCDIEDVEGAFGNAVALYVDFVRLQPFHDGNKRTARLVLNIFLTQFGFNAIAFEVPRAEHTAVMKTALDGDLRPLTDLVIRLAFDQLDH